MNRAGFLESRCMASATPPLLPQTNPRSSALFRRWHTIQRSRHPLAFAIPLETTPREVENNIVIAPRLYNAKFPAAIRGGRLFEIVADLQLGSRRMLARTTYGASRLPAASHHPGEIKTSASSRC